MRNNNYLYILIAFFYACTSPKEYIVHSVTQEKVVGYSKDCKYQIGKTRKDEIAPEVLKQLENDSLFLSFNHIWKEVASETLLSGWAWGDYCTSKGLKSGDTVEKALKLYGKPLATDLLYWEDKEHKFRMEFQGLFYKDMSFLVNPQKKSLIMGVIVGQQFPADKKYRIKGNGTQK